MEVYTFSEGSAYAGTGTVSSLMTYVRQVSISPAYTYQKYKPPHATTYTNYAIASAVTLSVGQARAQLAVVKMFVAATGGGFHFHTFQNNPGITQSAGIFLYSGNLQSLTIAEQTESEVLLSFAAVFPTWTAY